MLTRHRFSAKLAAAESVFELLDEPGEREPSPGAAAARAPATLDLPYDRPRPAVQDLRGGVHRFDLSPDGVQAARELARGGGATVFMVLVAKAPATANMRQEQE